MEQFECFDDAGNAIGLHDRSEVHRVGYWHRTVNVFLRNSAGELCLQQRAKSKDICPNLWDLSAAEHLQPGESYRAGAVRGLAEELGIGVAAASLELLSAERRTTLSLPERGILDREIHQCFQVVSDASIAFASEEVQAIRWLSRPELDLWFDRRAQDFTPWFTELYVDLRAALSVSGIALAQRDG